MKISRATQIFLSISLITLLVFLKIFYCDYIYGDDSLTIIHNSLYNLDLISALKIMSGTFIAGDYLPVMQLSYWVQNYFIGLSSYSSHLINFCIHIANIFLLLKYLEIKKYRLDLIACVVLLFAIHPLQIESVFWSSDRKGLLSALFLFLSLIAYEKSNSEKQNKFLFLSFLFFTLSLFSKMTAILLPLMICFETYLNKQVKKNQIIYILSLFLSLFLAACIRIMAINSYVPYIKSEDFWSLDRLANWALSLPTALGHYLKSLIWPTNLSFMYPLQSQFNFFSYEFFIFIFSSVVVYLIYRKSTQENKSRIIINLLFFVILLFPVLNLIPRNNFVNDRYMYIPLIFIVLIFLNFYLNLNISKTYKYLPLVALALFYISVSYQRSSVWLTNVTLWQDTVEKNPESQTAWNNLALSYREIGNWGQAIKSLEKAILVNTDETTPKDVLFINIAKLHSDKNHPEYYNKEAAIFYLQQAKNSTNSQSKLLQIENQIKTLTDNK